MVKLLDPSALGFAQFLEYGSLIRDRADYNLRTFLCDLSTASAARQSAMN